MRKDAFLLFNSLKYVISEIKNNFYRILTITKYEILVEHRDSKLGFLWSFLNPVIQIFSYWFAFGLGIRGGKAVDGIPFINWMLMGTIPWFFLSASLRNTTTSIHQRASIITKMKFPISILPVTIVLKELFTHIITLSLGYGFILLTTREKPIFSFEIIYYIICAVCFSVSFGMVTSVLNMFTRDVKKAVNSSMRLLMYVTPILWTMDKLNPGLQTLMRLNPLYYIIDGYRSSLFYHEGILSKPFEMAMFWVMVLSLFITGSVLMYKFKHKFIDFI